MITEQTIQEKVNAVLDIEHLPMDDQERIKQKMKTILYQRIMLLIFSKLPAIEQDKMKKLIEANLMDEVSDLINRYVPNVDELIEQEIKSSMEDYQGVAFVSTS